MCTWYNVESRHTFAVTDLQICTPVIRPAGLACLSTSVINALHNSSLATTGSLLILQSQEPSAADRQIRERVLREVNALVQPGLNGYHGMHVAPYGSFVSGLYTSTGDLDISIEGVRIS